MARVTVEDCLSYVENAFELVLRASSRARELQRGEADPLVAKEKDKPTVIALREIALGDEFIEALAKRKAEAAALERQGYEDYQDPVSLESGEIFKDLTPNSENTADSVSTEEYSAAQEAVNAEAEDLSSSADDATNVAIDKESSSDSDPSADSDKS